MAAALGAGCLSGPEGRSHAMLGRLSWWKNGSQPQAPASSQAAAALTCASRSPPHQILDCRSHQQQQPHCQCHAGHTAQPSLHWALPARGGHPTCSGISSTLSSSLWCVWVMRLALCPPFCLIIHSLSPPVSELRLPWQHQNQPPMRPCLNFCTSLSLS